MKDITTQSACPVVGCEDGAILLAEGVHPWGAVAENWIECPCCRGKGNVTQEKADKWGAENDPANMKDKTKCYCTPGYDCGYCIATTSKLVAYVVTTDGAEASVIAFAPNPAKAKTMAQ